MEETLQQIANTLNGIEMSLQCIVVILILILISIPSNRKG